jgi:hypothetical protein
MPRRWAARPPSPHARLWRALCSAVGGGSAGAEDAFAGVSAENFLGGRFFGVRFCRGAPAGKIPLGSTPRRAPTTAGECALLLSLLLLAPAGIAVRFITCAAACLLFLSVPSQLAFVACFPGWACIPPCATSLVRALAVLPAARAAAAAAADAARAHGAASAQSAKTARAEAARPPSGVGRWDVDWWGGVCALVSVCAAGLLLSPVAAALILVKGPPLALRGGLIAAAAAAQAIGRFVATGNIVLGRAAPVEACGRAEGEWRATGTEARACCCVRWWRLRWRRRSSRLRSASLPRAHCC